MKKPIGTTHESSKVSSSLQSSYVSPYRTGATKKMLKIEKIMEKTNIQDINKKIKALNQQYVK